MIRFSPETGSGVCYTFTDPLLTSIPPDVKQIDGSYDGMREPRKCLFNFALKADGSYVVGEHRRKIDTLAVRTINVEEKRLVRQVGVSTRCRWYPTVRLVDR